MPNIRDWQLFKFHTQTDISARQEVVNEVINNIEGHRFVYYTPLYTIIPSLCKNGTAIAPPCPDYFQILELKKRNNHQLMLDGVQRFAREHICTNSEMCKEVSWIIGSSSVLIKPSFKMMVNGEVHIIKLYMKKRPPEQERISFFQHIMLLACQGTDYANARFSLFDVRTSTLHSISSEQIDDNYVQRLSRSVSEFETEYNRHQILRFPNDNQEDQAEAA